MIGTRFRRVAMGSLVALLVATVGVRAQDDAGAQFEAGLDKFRSGDLQGAYELFELAYAQSPSSDLVASFVEKARVATIYSMVRSDDPRISGVGLEMLRTARGATLSAGADEEAISSAIDSVFGATESEDRVRAMIEGAHKYGRNLVAGLIPALADSDLSRRALAMSWISMIGLDAVPPLVAATKHSEPRVRSNVSALLGARKLRNSYSLGYLQRLVETDSESLVKESASKSVAAILADIDGAGSVRAAKEYLLDSARLLALEPHRSPFTSRKYIPGTFDLVDDAIVMTRVAPFQVTTHMADQCLHDALALDSGWAPAREQILCNDALRLVNYDANSAWYETQDGYEDVKTVMAEQKPYVDTILANRVLSAPGAILYSAIERSARDDRPEITRRLIEAVRTRAPRGPVPTELVAALEDGNSRLVRLAAAATIAYWNPTEGFDAGSQVIEILANAAVQSGVRTVVKGMGNQIWANRFDALLRDELNMESYLQKDNVAETLQIVQKMPPDVIFLDEELKLNAGDRARQPLNVLVNELRKSYRTAEVPVIIVVDAGRVAKAKELYESVERKVFVVGSNIDSLSLQKSVLEPLFAGKTDGKALATRLASDAAGALAYLSSVHTFLPVDEAVDALGRVLTNRPDSVRVPSIVALGRLATVQQILPLAQVFQNTNNAPVVRREAMTAIGRILEAVPSALSNDVLATIQAGALENDPSIRTEAWIAFGKSGASGTDHLALISTGEVATGAASGGAGSAGDMDDTTGDDPIGGEAEDDSFDDPADEDLFGDDDL